MHHAREKPQQSCGYLSRATGAPAVLGLVLVFIDTFANSVLLTINPFLLGLREMAVVLCHVPLFAILYARFALFEVGGLPRIQLSTLKAIGDALLLPSFTTIDLVHARMAGIDDSGTRARRIG